MKGVVKMTTNEKGNIGLGQAIAYFTSQQYIVSIPLNDSQFYDLIVEKEGKLQTVQVKYTSEKSKGNNFKCNLRTTSGTSRETLYSVIETKTDLLFCYCENGDKYLIPVKDIKNSNSITLSKDKLRIGFDTSIYYIV